MVSGVLGRKTTSQIGSISHERARERVCTGDRSLTPIRYIGETFDQPYMSRIYGPTYSTYMSTLFFFFLFFYDRPRAFSSRLAPPPHRMENSNAYALVLFYSMRNRKLRWSAIDWSFNHPLRRVLRFLTFLFRVLRAGANIARHVFVLGFIFSEIASRCLCRLTPWPLLHTLSVWCFFFWGVYALSAVTGGK